MAINNWQDALVPSLVGMGVVFFMLVLIMLVISFFPAIFRPKQLEKPAMPVSPTVPEKPAELPGSKKLPAKGSLGELKLYDTDERTAALIMAIVADKTQKPLNTLRFESIKRLS